MAEPKDVLTLAYMSSGDDADKLRAVLEVLLPAVYPSDPYPAFVVKRPTPDFPNRHLHINVALNKATKDLLESVLERLVGRPFDIGYTSEDTTLNRKVEIEAAVEEVRARFKPPTPAAPFGPKTKEEAAADQAVLDAEMAQYWRDHEAAASEQAERNEREQAQARYDFPAD